MEITYNKDRSVLTMYFIGELDESVANTARQTMEAIIYSNSFKTLVLDLKNLNFMDSTGIGVIIGRYKQLKARNISAYVVNVTSNIDKIFRISGLYDILPLLD
ncbi:MAG: anti-sigma factor antagonist [Clostridia bacterium]